MTLSQMEVVADCDVALLLHARGCRRYARTLCALLGVGCVADRAVGAAVGCWDLAPPRSDVPRVGGAITCVCGVTGCWFLHICLTCLHAGVLETVPSGVVSMYEHKHALIVAVISHAGLLQF